MKHQVTRVRRDTRRRLLTVREVANLTPAMRRITFESPDLRDFESAAPDDHIKLFFPPLPGAVADGKPCMRDFTPRAFDTASGTLTVDFALHDAGPATHWAAQATAGQTLEIGGPRGSAIVPDDFDFYLLIGDETAIPAIGRWVGELRAGAPVTTLIIVNDAAGELSFLTRASLTPIWVHRAGNADDAAALQAALQTIELPSGEGYIWIAAEASVAKSVRAYLLAERDHPREWLKAAGYWKRGQADVHERIED
jgi:NADPH-dependent ferric siderophore reductase